MPIFGMHGLLLDNGRQLWAGCLTVEESYITNSATIFVYVVVWKIYHEKLGTATIPIFSYKFNHNYTYNLHFVQNEAPLLCKILGVVRISLLWRTLFTIA